MEFSENKPIYIQIADSICEQILQGRFKIGERIPSVREWGASIGVNPNTVARSYELLTARGVIESQRGIGNFVTEDAVAKVLEFGRREFLEVQLPEFTRRAALLGIDLKGLV